MQSRPTSEGEGKGQDLNPQGTVWTIKAKVWTFKAKISTLKAKVWTFKAKATVPRPRPLSI